MQIVTVAVKLLAVASFLLILVGIGMHDLTYLLGGMVLFSVAWLLLIWLTWPSEPAAGWRSDL